MISPLFDPARTNRFNNSTDLGNEKTLEPNNSCTSAVPFLLEMSVSSWRDLIILLVCLDFCTILYSPAPVLYPIISSFKCLLDFCLPHLHTREILSLLDTTGKTSTHPSWDFKSIS